MKLVIAFILILLGFSFSAATHAGLDGRFANLLCIAFQVGAIVIALLGKRKGKPYGWWTITVVVIAVMVLLLAAMQLV